MTDKDTKSGKGLPKQKSAGRAKTDARYWEDRIFKPSFTRNGETLQARHYSMRVCYAGKRHNFPLGTGNKTAAGRKAAGIYTMIATEGWDAALLAHSPSHAEKKSGTSVGDVIGILKGALDVGPVTFAEYSRALRRIAADIAGIPRERKIEVRRRRKVGDKYRIVTVTEVVRPNMAGSGKRRDEWVERVDATPLSTLTPKSARKWMIAYVEENGGSTPKSRKSAKRSANTCLRKAKSLFSKKALKTLKDYQITLPSELPFEGVDFFDGVKPPRYTSRVDAEELFRDAVDELAEHDTEMFKVFLLAISGGLRRGEIDTLLWEQLDAKDGRIIIETTDRFDPKSEESSATVELDREVATILQGYRARATGDYVIESARESKPNATYSYYRAEEVFDRLLLWLAKKGIGGEDNRRDKPLHTLRKEFGSLLCKRYGLFAAYRALRHSSPEVTAAHYLDQKERTPVGLGHLLAQEREDAS